MSIQVEGDSSALVKGGETVIQTNLRRTADGLTLTIRTHPRVEQFLAALGAGAPIEDAGIYNRYWNPANGVKGLPVHGLSPDKTIQGWINVDNRLSYRLDRPGGPLYERNQDTGILGLNLSFLRLVGTSEGGGQSFTVKGVYSTEQLQTLRMQLMSACQHFYVSYLKPVNVTVLVSTQEI